LGFPNPVNEVAARTVAAGVVVMAVVAVAADVPWLLIPLTYGFWARVLTGPRLSPLGLLATRVIVPRLPVAERLTPGPPKRFAQAIGALVTTTAVIMWVTAGWADARWLLLLIIVAAVAESAFGFCVGCRIFSLLMRHGVIPTSVCEECGDLGRRHPELAHRAE
jgi:hypothetical protein